MIFNEGAFASKEEVFRYFKTSVFGFEGTTLGELLNQGQKFRNVTEEVNFPLGDNSKLDSAIIFETQNALLGGEEQNLISIRNPREEDLSVIKWSCWLKKNSEYSIQVEWFNRDNKDYVTITFENPGKRKSIIFFDNANRNCVIDLNHGATQPGLFKFDQILNGKFMSANDLIINSLKLTDQPTSNPFIAFKFKSFPPNNQERALTLPQRIKMLT